MREKVSRSIVVWCGKCMRGGSCWRSQRVAQFFCLKQSMTNRSYKLWCRKWTRVYYISVFWRIQAENKARRKSIWERQFVLSSLSRRRSSKGVARLVPNLATPAAPKKAIPHRMYLGLKKCNEKLTPFESERTARMPRAAAVCCSWSKLKCARREASQRERKVSTQSAVPPPRVLLFVFIERAESSGIWKKADCCVALFRGCCAPAVFVRHSQELKIGRCYSFLCYWLCWQTTMRLLKMFTKDQIKPTQNACLCDVPVININA